MINVDKYTIHGSYGICNSPEIIVLGWYHWVFIQKNPTQVSNTCLLQKQHAMLKAVAENTILQVML